MLGEWDKFMLVQSAGYCLLFVLLLVSRVIGITQCFVHVVTLHADLEHFVAVSAFTVVTRIPSNRLQARNKLAAYSKR